MIRIGTRGSRLALTQVDMVIAALKNQFPDVEAEVITITTSGDRSALKNAPMEEGKGDFVKEIENALLDGRIDAAVHSMKDLPVNLPEGLSLVACLRMRDEERGEDELTNWIGLGLDECACPCMLRVPGMMLRVMISGGRKD